MIKHISLSLVTLLLVGGFAEAALIHQWKLDETTLTYDGSTWAGVIDSAAGTPTGNLWGYGGTDPVNTNVINQPGAHGFPDGAYNFIEPTGISTVTTNNMTAVPATGDFTVLVTMKTTNLHTAQGHLFSNNNGQAGRANLHLLNGSLMWFHNGGASITETASPIFDGQWHEVGISRQGSNFYLLRDGFVVGTGTGAGAFSTNTWWMIGRQRSFAGDFDGQISDVRIYDQVYTNVIRTRAFGPTPAAGTVGVATNPTLEWNTALDPATPLQANPAVTTHYLYLATEPNFVSVSPIPIAASGPTGSYAATLAMDTTYYWRVDESLNNAAPGDPNTTKGYMWSFETIKSVPVITEQPSDAFVEAGQTAALTVAVQSLSPAFYTWYKVVSGGTDTVMAGPTLDGNTLTVVHAQIADEGVYYCKITNSSGEQNAVVSDTAVLGIKRLMAHWTLDADTFVGGQYLDETGNYLAEPNDPAAAAAAFVPGIAGDAIAVNTGSFANAGTWRPNAYTAQMTVSAWVKITGAVTGDSQGIVSKRNAAGADWSLYVRGGDASHAGNNYVRFCSFAGGDVWAGPNAAAAGEWVHVLAVVDGGNVGRVYINGLQAATDTTWTFGPNPNAPLLLGRGMPDGLTLPGQLDDVKIYNYALSAVDIATLYAGVSGKPVCLYPPDARLNISGPGGQPDCVVDLYDFAAFAAGWLESGLIYPTAP